MVPFGSGSVLQGYFFSGLLPALLDPVVQPRSSFSPIVHRGGSQSVVQVPANLSNFGNLPGHSLPELVQRKMEALFNARFDDVRVHVGPQPAALGALAFTHGSHIYFAP